MPTAPSSASIHKYSTLDRLRKNDVTLTKLKLSRDKDDYADNFQDFLDCLRQNTTVKYVLLERHFFRSLSKEEWKSVLQAVGQMKQLEEVEIWSVRVNLKELCEAFQHSTHLGRLGFGFVTLAGDMDASALNGHPSLKTFYVSDFRLSQEGATLDSLCRALSTCPKLENLEVFQYQQETPPFSASGLASLMESSSLRHLTLRRMGLTAELVKDLAQNLTTNSGLRVLNLNENQLGNDGCEPLAAALKFNTTLHEVNLRKNQLTAEGCVCFTQQLQHNTGLEKINLACNPLEDLGGQGLAQLLRNHPSLKTLELHKTHLTDVGCTGLLETLRQNNTLLHLDLSFNEITELTYLQAAEALRDNRSLKTINLQVNKKMKVIGCQALVGMLQENTVLEDISTLLRVRFEPQEYHQVEAVLHQMNLFLKLNHAGRHGLLQGRFAASRKDWGNSLLAVQDDLNGLFYLAQANPAVICDCFLHSESPTNTSITATPAVVV